MKAKTFEQSRNQLLERDGWESSDTRKYDEEIKSITQEQPSKSICQTLQTLTSENLEYSLE